MDIAANEVEVEAGREMEVETSKSRKHKSKKSKSKKSKSKKLDIGSETAESSSAAASSDDEIESGKHEKSKSRKSKSKKSDTEKETTEVPSVLVHAAAEPEAASVQVWASITPEPGIAPVARSVAMEAAKELVPGVVPALLSADEEEVYVPEYIPEAPEEEEKNEGITVDSGRIPSIAEEGLSVTSIPVGPVSGDVDAVSMTSKVATDEVNVGPYGVQTGTTERGSEYEGENEVPEFIPGGREDENEVGLDIDVAEPTVPISDECGERFEGRYVSWLDAINQSVALLADSALNASAEVTVDGRRGSEGEEDAWNGEVGWEKEEEEEAGDIGTILDDVTRASTGVVSEIESETVGYETYGHVQEGSVITGFVPPPPEEDEAELEGEVEVEGGGETKELKESEEGEAGASGVSLRIVVSVSDSQTESTILSGSISSAAILDVTSISVPVTGRQTALDESEQAATSIPTQSEEDESESENLPAFVPRPPEDEEEPVEAPPAPEFIPPAPEDEEEAEEFPSIPAFVPGVADEEGQAEGIPAITAFVSPTPEVIPAASVDSMGEASKSESAEEIPATTAGLEESMTENETSELPSTSESFAREKKSKKRDSKKSKSRKPGAEKEGSTLSPVTDSVGEEAEENKLRRAESGGSKLDADAGDESSLVKDMGGEVGKGKSDKHKSNKHKSNKHKSNKHKSDKHKSKKSKSRKSEAEADEDNETPDVSVVVESISGAVEISKSETETPELWLGMDIAANEVKVEAGREMEVETSKSRKHKSKKSKSKKSKSQKKKYTAPAAWEPITGASELTPAVETVVPEPGQSRSESDASSSEEADVPAKQELPVAQDVAVPITHVAVQPRGAPPGDEARVGPAAPQKAEIEPQASSAAQVLEELAPEVGPVSSAMAPPGGTKFPRNPRVVAPKDRKVAVTRVLRVITRKPLPERAPKAEAAPAWRKPLPRHPFESSLSSSESESESEPGDEVECDVLGPSWLSSLRRFAAPATVCPPSALARSAGVLDLPRYESDFVEPAEGPKRLVLGRRKAVRAARMLDLADSPRVPVFERLEPGEPIVGVDQFSANTVAPPQVIQFAPPLDEAVMGSWYGRGPVVPALARVSIADMAHTGRRKPPPLPDFALESQTWVLNLTWPYLRQVVDEEDA
jgi:hypothetical protein